MTRPRNRAHAVFDLDLDTSPLPKEDPNQVPPVPTPLPRVATKADIPSGVECSLFLKDKKAPFYRNPGIVQVFEDHQGSIRCLAASPTDSTLLASGGEDGFINLYQFHGRLVKLRQFGGHSSDVSCLAFSCDNHLISGSLDLTVRLWHPSHAKEVRVFQHEDAVTAVAVHPRDSSVFIACTFANSVWVWNIRDNTVIHTISFASPPTTATFSPDGQMIAIGCFNGFCFFYALPDFRYVTQFVAGPRRKKKAQNKKVTSIVFRNATQFFVSTNDSRIRLYSSDNYSVIRKYVGHVSTRTNQRVSYSTKGDLILSGSEKRGGIFIWPVEHEQFFQGRMSKFSRDRSTTFEGFLLGKQAFVTAAVFTGENSLDNLSLIVGDSDGRLFFIGNS
jgi:WD40 repeat protein